MNPGRLERLDVCLSHPRDLPQVRLCLYNYKGRGVHAVQRDRLCGTGGLEIAPLFVPCTFYSNTGDANQQVTDTLYPLLVISVMIYYVQPVA